MLWRRGQRKFALQANIFFGYRKSRECSQKSLIFERAAFPSKSVSTFSTRSNNGALKLRYFQSVDKPQSLLFRRLCCIFCFSADMRGGKTPCKRKTAEYSGFSRALGWYWRSITTDCRLWRIKGGRYGAAVKENSRAEQLFSVCSARVGSAVRKSVIFKRTAFP